MNWKIIIVVVFTNKQKDKKKGSCDPHQTYRFGLLDPKDEIFFEKTFIFTILVGFWINDARKNGPH